MMLINKLFYFSFVLGRWKKRKWCRKSDSSVEDMPHGDYVPDMTEKEYQKPPLHDFTLTEYTEKVILYGYLMVREFFLGGNTM